MPLTTASVARGVSYAAPVLGYELVHDFPMSREGPQRSTHVALPRRMIRGERGALGARSRTSAPYHRSTSPSTSGLVVFGSLRRSSLVIESSCCKSFRR